MVRFLDPETAEILQFLDTEIVKIDKKISGSRIRRYGVISRSRNRRKGRQILYGLHIDVNHRYHIVYQGIKLYPTHGGGVGGLLTHLLLKYL